MTPKEWHLATLYTELKNTEKVLSNPALTAEDFDYFFNYKEDLKTQISELELLTPGE